MNNKINWTPEEIHYLIELNRTAQTIDDYKVAFPQYTYAQITAKLYRMKLNKPFDGRANANLIRNKCSGRDLTFEYCNNIAKTYNSRSELQREDGSVYQTARRNKWLDQICSHMSTPIISGPEIIARTIFGALLGEAVYNTRSIVKPYELDIFYPKFKLAVEVNGDYWHRDNPNDLIKTELCQKLGIIVCYINCTNQWTLKDIQSEIINNMHIVNKVCRTTFTVDDITSISIDPSKYIESLDKLKQICLRYNDYTTFASEQPILKNKLWRKGLLKEFTGHMIRRNKNHRHPIVPLILEVYKEYTS